MATALKSLLALGVAALVLGACDSRVRAIESRLDPRQRELFAQGRRLSTQCWSCHDFYAENNKIGPHLVGVVGRRAGGVTGFAYSPAMLASGVVWERGTLRSYLANPPALIPGTTMVSRGVGGGQELDALIFYIEQLSAHDAREVN